MEGMIPEKRWERAWKDFAASCGNKTNATSKDPQRKRVPRTFGKKRTGTEPKPYQKKMA